jgi:hypothetical protein
MPLLQRRTKDEAIKCRYCQSFLVPGVTSAPSGLAPTATGKITYVVDEGLVSYGKFVIGVLGVFILVGTYLFGIKLEVTVQRMHDAQRQLEQSRTISENQASLAQKDIQQASKTLSKAQRMSSSSHRWAQH